MKKDYPTLSLRERDRRWELVRGLMKEGELNCLIVAGLRGRAQLDGYLSNEIYMGMVVFPLEGSTSYLTWNPYFITRQIAHQNPPPKKYWDILGDELWVFFPKFSETAQA